MLVVLPNNTDWDCFKTLLSREILKIQNPLLEEHFAFLEVIHLFQQVGCARNKLLFLTVQQNLKSALWTLDWDWMVCPLWNYGIWLFLFLNIFRVSDRTGKLVNGEDKHHKSHEKIDVTKDIDSFPSNVQSARQDAFLYVFEDNEAVIKMLIKGRSLAMRHVSRTHRVALDWLFDRINLDRPKPNPNQIHRDQKSSCWHFDQRNSTRDGWNHLLNLFNISHFSPTVCSSAMAKRIQQKSGEERDTAKSRPWWF